jgi:hypothetical protein
MSCVGVFNHSLLWSLKGRYCHYLLPVAAPPVKEFVAKADGEPFLPESGDGDEADQYGESMKRQGKPPDPQSKSINVPIATAGEKR